MRPQNKHEKQQAESDNVLIGGGDETGAEAFDETEHQPADDRSVSRREPAECRGGKALDADPGANIDLGERDRAHTAPPSPPSSPAAIEGKGPSRR